MYVYHYLATLLRVTAFVVAFFKSSVCAWCMIGIVGLVLAVILEGIALSSAM